MQSRLQPCQNPISYSIGEVDPRFNLTEDELLQALQTAEGKWESPISKNLFTYSATGDMQINLIYDYRQKATDDLRRLGLAIDDDRSSYESVKAKYYSLTAQYDQTKAQLDSLRQKYETQKQAYEQEVNQHNSRGGAPKEEYEALEQRRIDLNNQVATINELSVSLNQLVDTIESTEIILNKLVGTLNLQVDSYNSVSSATGDEFNQGEYVSGFDGRAINIFQFNEEPHLIRVLTHEFGHALGLDHLENPSAIMYYLNEGVNDNLTTDDESSLRAVCKIKSE